MNKLPLPAWARYFRVDEVIECLPLSTPHPFTPEGDAQREKVEKALLRLMPNAYAAHEDDPDGESGRNETPEVDSHNDRKLARIWHRLDGDIQQVIIDAYKVENPGD